MQGHGITYGSMNGLSSSADCTRLVGYQGQQGSVLLMKLQDLFLVASPLQLLGPYTA